MLWEKAQGIIMSEQKKLNIKKFGKHVAEAAMFAGTTAIGAIAIFAYATDMPANQHDLDLARENLYYSEENYQLVYDTVINRSYDTLKQDTTYMRLLNQFYDEIKRGNINKSDSLERKIDSLNSELQNQYIHNNRDLQKAKLQLDASRNRVKQIEQYLKYNDSVTLGQRWREARLNANLNLSKYFDKRAAIVQQKINEKDR